ncbi:MAG: hypothetical protein JWP88_729 [Flaviaesturariibacter sp.]|nr:hypothetical protein [Flaviaesturariibacter sp.]
MLSVTLQPSFSIIFSIVIVTFKATENCRRNWQKFSLVSLIVLGLNTVIIYILSRRSVNFYISKVIAVGLVFSWNYTGNRSFYI